MTASHFKLFVATALAASAVSCSSSPPPPAQAFVNASLKSPTSGGGACNLNGNGPVFTIGTASSPTPKVVSDGQSFTGEGVPSVSCKVSATNDGYSLDLQETDYLGTFTLLGDVTYPTIGGTVSITISTQGGSSYASSASTCTISYEYNGLAVPYSPPIAGGRIFGHVHCDDGIKLASDPTIDCGADVDILFDNCAQ